MRTRRGDGSRGRQPEGLPVDTKWEPKDDSQSTLGACNDDAGYTRSGGILNAATAGSQGVDCFIDD